MLQKTTLKVLFLFLSILLFGCQNQEHKPSLDGKKLLEQKCASCHNLEMPPVLSKDELAPPMMAVSFHVHSFVKPKDESQRVSKAIAFVVDYVQDPSVEKSFCDKESLSRYGLMPSQKKSVTKDESSAIATYMFAHFTQKNLTQAQKLKAEYEALAEGKKIALRYKCLSCHHVSRNMVGPSFKSIAIKYRDKDIIIEGIKNRSSRKWNKKSAAIMPAFNNLSSEELEELSKWILETQSL